MSGPPQAGPAGAAAHPARILGLADAVAMIVGIVVGAGIFRAPSLVAANASSETAVLLAWAAGGMVALAGALCYAELASTYPSAGGEYHFLSRAYGSRLAFFLGWGRLAVIQTGSIALLAFVFGDYATRVFPLGAQSAAWYAALVVVALTAVNIAGVRQGAGTQKALTALEVAGVVFIIAVGLNGPAADPAPAASAATSTAVGLVMVFVLLTYGGWNEAAYLSAELKGERTIVRALVLSIAVIAGLYLLVNLAYLRALGLGGMAASEAVAADAIRPSLGDGAARALSVIVAISALTSANATIFTGARTNYALGRDVRMFSGLARWDPATGTPRVALLAQAVVALGLVAFGTLARKGFETMVEYTAPVFWLFVLLVALSLFVLRRRDPETPRRFRVPLYPVTPALFAAAAAYLCYSSLVYTGIGALAGVAVLAVGGVVLLADHRQPRSSRQLEGEEAT
ncbi:MAG TPA: amino acid permease [Gemmatimonadales bacterium]|nr:amino acid permease [Gemmatimonadales bacterium]